jgi:hypothetical protein
LAKDLPGKDSEIFVEPGYDLEASYGAARKAGVSNCGMCVTLYDNLFPGYSPKGKNTVNILALQGFDHWEKFKNDYWKGHKSAYRAGKERMAEVMIRRAGRALPPGLSKAIEVKVTGTPLTNMRYTGHPPRRHPRMRSNPEQFRQPVRGPFDYGEEPLSGGRLVASRARLWRSDPQRDRVLRRNRSKLELSRGGLALPACVQHCENGGEWSQTGSTTRWPLPPPAALSRI